MVILVDRTPFVGRERELAALRRMLDAAIAGDGGVALVAGEPGIGKTRLATEIAATAEARGARVLWGRCYEGEGAPAYWPWVQAVRTYARAAEPESLRADIGTGMAELAQLTPIVAERLGIDAASESFSTGLPLDPAQARFRLFDSVSSFFLSTARRQPLVLILDDLHWADVASLLLLQFLGRESAQGAAPLLVIGTYRQDEVGPEHPLNAVLTELAREQSTTELGLRGLSEQELGHLVALAVDSEARPEVARAVYHASEGNPFYAAEIVRLLAVEGLPEPAAGWRPAIPRNVRGVIGRRLERLPAACQQMLTIAAVIGREFHLTTLSRASETESTALLTQLEAAVTAQIVAEERDGLARYRFTHALIRDALYDALGPAQRVRLHRQVGLALEEVATGAREIDLAELAHHFVQAAPGGEAAKAVEYARAAGDEATRLLAYEEAVRWYEAALAALELAPAPEERLRCALLLALGDGRAKAGDLPAASATYVQAAEIARRLSITGEVSHGARLLADAALGYGQGYPAVQFHVWAVDPTWERLYGEALAALAADEQALRARLLAGLAEARYYAGHTGEQTPLLDEAVKTARDAGDHEALLFALLARHNTLAGPEHTETRVADAETIIVVAEEIREHEWALHARELLIEDLLETGDAAAAGAVLAIYAREAEELRRPVALWRAAATRSMLACMDGRLDEAERWAEEALAVGQRVEPFLAWAGHVIQLAAVRGEQGRASEAIATCEEMLAVMQGTAAPRIALSIVLLYEGHAVDVHRHVEVLAADGFVALPRDRTRVAAAAAVAELCAYLGDTERAPVLYRLLLPSASRAIQSPFSWYWWGSAARSLGLLAATMGDWATAERHFEHALAMHSRPSVRLWRVRAQREYAMMLLARAAPGDRERAASLLAQGLVTANELGLVWLAGKIQQLQTEPLASAASVVFLSAARPAYPDGLTAREVEVLGLLAAGHSNPEIAETLVLSAGTVARHTANIYAKIGARGRADAVAYAVRHDISPP